MTTNIQRAGIVARHVQLHSVTLRDAQLDSQIDPLEVPEDLELTQGYRARFEHNDSHQDHLYVFVDFQLTAGPAAQDKTEADATGVRLKATYLLVYQLSQGVEQPEDALAHFAELNGAYNAWPYWRELVQSVTGRVGLTAIVIPVFRPPVRELVEVDQQSTPPKPKRKAAVRKSAMREKK
jgi:hypothetical protein